MLTPCHPGPAQVLQFLPTKLTLLLPTLKLCKVSSLTSRLSLRLSCSVGRRANIRKERMTDPKERRKYLGMERQKKRRDRREENRKRREEKRRACKTQIMKEKNEEEYV